MHYKNNIVHMTSAEQLAIDTVLREIKRDIPCAVDPTVHCDDCPAYMADNCLLCHVRNALATMPLDDSQPDRYQPQPCSQPQDHLVDGEPSSTPSAIARLDAMFSCSDVQCDDCPFHSTALDHCLVVLLADPPQQTDEHHEEEQ